MRLDRELLHVLAGDVPLLGDHLGAAELRDLLVAVARHPARRPGERVGEAELLGRRVIADADRDLRSCSARRRRRRGRRCPHITACAAKCTACCDEPHCRSTVVPGTSSGSPAASQQVRAMSPACGPIVSTQPKTTSSTAAGSMPVRSTSALIECAPRSAGCTAASAAAALADRACGRRRRCRPRA